jgi:hypothetical protein
MTKSTSRTRAASALAFLLAASAPAVADDAFEPNDSSGAAASLGAVPVARSSLVLETANEDWYSVTLAAASSSLAADAKYDPAASGATVELEIRADGGALLATGTFDSATSALHAATGAVSAGTYRIGVKHVAGAAAAGYSLQAYLPLGLPEAPVHDWTIGRDYNRPLGVVGGIPPFAVTIQSGQLPLGMGLDSISLAAVGRPNVVGTFPITVQVRDNGNPANVFQRSQLLTINEVFKLPPAPFVGFTADRAVDVVLPTTGGTQPFTLTTIAGGLPAGLSFAPNSLHVTGTPVSGQASSFLTIHGVDFAGSSDQLDYRAVVARQIAGRNIPAGLANGPDACGWWFDAVAGSTVTFSVKTARGSTLRSLEGTLVAPDSTVVTSGVIRSGTGLIRAARLVCPTSGRYFFFASTNSPGLSSHLLGTIVVATKRVGRSVRKDYAPDETTTFEIGALPGSTTTLRFAGDRRATLVAKVVSVTDPDGVEVPTAALVKSTPVGGTLTLPMPVGGTWKIVLGATTTSGAPGRFTYSYVVKQAKGAVYSAN